MIYVGIDVASEKHDVCIMNGNGEVFKHIFTISNHKSEYKKLLNSIEEAKKLWKDSKVSIGIESTGVYSEVLVNYLSKIEDLDIVYINPILTNMFQHSECVHYAKTDAADAKGICLYLSSKSKRLFTYTQPSYHIKELKSLSRETKRIGKDINKIANHLRGVLHVVFPEIFKCFRDICTDTCVELLIKYPTPDLIGNKRSYSDIYSKLNKGKRIKLDSLKELAKNTIGSWSESDGLVIKSLAQNLKLLMNQKKHFVQRLEVLSRKYCKNLLTVPGIGPINACTIMGEIGNINNFHGADSLIAFAGLNPIVYESGKYKGTGLSISKKGSPYLRNAIVRSSNIIVMFDDKFREYFEKKISEGKPYKVAMGHVSKKLIRVIYQILKKDVKYV